VPSSTTRVAGGGAAAAGAWAGIGVESARTAHAIEAACRARRRERMVANANIAATSPWSLSSKPIGHSRPKEHMTMLRLILVPAVLMAASFAQGTAADPSYAVTYTLDQGVYSGTTTFNVDRKGVVTGKMSLTSPIAVEGTLNGEVKDGTWTFDYPYTIAEQGCTGTVKGTAKVSADRKTISGDATIGGACVEQPTPATFTFIRK
jgi:hypothetical protein